MIQPTRRQLWKQQLIFATIKEDLANSAFPSNNKQPKVGVAGRTSK
jgi:hypothetical protein